MVDVQSTIKEAQILECCPLVAFQIIEWAKVQMRPETTVILMLKYFKTPSFCQSKASSSRSTEVNTLLSDLQLAFSEDCDSLTQGRPDYLAAVQEGL